jgi:hypothetical protein
MPIQEAQPALAEGLQRERDCEPSYKGVDGACLYLICCNINIATKSLQLYWIVKNLEAALPYNLQVRSFAVPLAALLGYKPVTKPKNHRKSKHVRRSDT